MISFTPVRQSEDILALHLESLDRQGLGEQWFYDDNDTPSDLLLSRTTLDKVPGLPAARGYERNEQTHRWESVAIARVAAIKNHAIDTFLKTDSDHLFLIDSDVIPEPGTVEHLLEADQPIISSVFWTRWQPDAEEMPNVWDIHNYGFVGSWERFRRRGHHVVGGLGACTLIHRSVFESGVRFDAVAGVNFHGEDRHFCIRASARDIPLTACTHMDVKHIYRESDLEPTRAWWIGGFANG